MAESAGEKSHPATPHRREQARREGQVPRSQDLASASVLLTAIGAIYFLGHDLADQLQELTVLQLSVPKQQLTDVSDAAAQLREFTWIGLRLLVPILGGVLASAVLTLWSQGGFLVLPGKLEPQWSHIAPSRGIQRMLSPAHGMRMVMNILKLLVCGAIAWLSIHRQHEQILACHHLEIPELTRFLVDTLVGTAFQITAGLTLLALIDYGYQYWQHERDLRMTDQELRDELRTLQGDPQHHSRRRGIQQERYSAWGTTDASSTSR